MSATRPFDPKYLLSYCEHVAYEIDMLRWLVVLIPSDPTTVFGGATPQELLVLKNALIESFVIHTRNIIDFLYLKKPYPTDVVAADYFPAGVWQATRPPISPSLEAARVRANKEISHLTSARISGRPPEKGWNFSGIAAEVLPILRIFASKAPTTSCSPDVQRAVS